MTEIANNIDFIYCGDNKDIYEMMYNNYKKSLQEKNQKIEWGIDSGSLSDRTLTMEDALESSKLRCYKVISKIGDEDFYNYNFIDKYYSEDAVESNNNFEESTDKEDNNTHENTLTRSATTVTVSTDGHDADQSIISIPCEEEKKDKKDLKALKENIIRKNTLERKKITKNSDSLIKADAKDIDFSLINDEDDEEEDYSNNDILFIPKNIEKDLNINSKDVRNSLKNRKHKKSKSDGTYIAMKNKNNLIKNEKNHHFIENQDQERRKLHDSAPLPSKNRFEHKKNRNGEEGSQRIERSHSTKCPSIPPRSESKVHMKEFMRKQRESNPLNNNNVNNNNNNDDDDNDNKEDIKDNQNNSDYELETESQTSKNISSSTTTSVTNSKSHSHQRVRDAIDEIIEESIKMEEFNEIIDSKRKFKTIAAGEKRTSPAKRNKKNSKKEENIPIINEEQYEAYLSYGRK